MDDKKIKVRVKQAHREMLPGGFKDHPVDEILMIEEKDFADNLHEKIGFVPKGKKIEEEGDGTRTKKHRPVGPEPV